MTFNMMTANKNHHIMTNSAITLSLITLSITLRTIMTHSKQHSAYSIVMLSVAYAECGALTVMLSVITLNVVAPQVLHSLVLTQ